MRLYLFIILDLAFFQMALRTELRNSIEKAPLHSSGFFSVLGCLLCAGSA